MTGVVAKLLFTGPGLSDLEWTLEITSIHGPKISKDMKKRQPGIPKFISKAFGGKIFPAVFTDFGQASSQWLLKCIGRDLTWTGPDDILSDILTLREHGLKNAYIYSTIYLVFVGVKESDDLYFVENSNGIEVKINNLTPVWECENLYYNFDIELVEGFDFDI